MAARIYYPAAVCALTARWAGPDPAVDYGSTTFEGLAPRSFAAENNGIRTADEIKKLIFDARDFPFDPRLVRSIEIALFLGLRDNGDAPYKPRMENGEAVDVLFTGFIDLVKREWTDKGELVEFEGRDYTALFLDQPYPKPHVPVRETLQEVLEELIGQLPGGKKIELVIETGADHWVTGKDVEKPAKGPVGKRGRAGPVPFRLTLPKPTKQTGKLATVQHNYWDVIQELCDGLGLVAFMQGTKLIVCPPRNLSDRARQGAPALVWGYNVEKLKIEKHVGHQRAPNIKVTSYEASKGKAHSAVYPDPPLASSIVKSPDGTEQKTVRIHNYVVRDLTSKAACKRVAQRIYEEIRSNEIAVELETRDMKALRVDAAFKADDSDYEYIDLTRVRDGWPISIDVDGDMAPKMDRLSVGGRAQELVARGYKPAVANELARKWEDLRGFDKTLRVQTAKHEWSNEKGYRLTIKAVNYLNIGSALPAGGLSSPVLPSRF